MCFQAAWLFSNGQPEILGVAGQRHTLTGLNVCRWRIVVMLCFMLIRQPENGWNGFQAAFVLMAVVEWGCHLATSRRRSILGFRLPVG